MIMVNAEKYDDADGNDADDGDDDGGGGGDDDDGESISNVFF